MQPEFIEMIAKVCYSAVRAHYRIIGDKSIAPWSNVAENAKQHAINRVIFFLKNPEKITMINDSSIEHENISRMFRAITLAFTQ